MKYNAEMIKFILDNYKTNPTKIQKDFNKKFSLNKTKNALRKVFEMYNSIEFDSKSMIDAEKKALRASTNAKAAASSNKALIQDMVTQEDFLEEFKKNIKPIKVISYKSKEKKKIKRELNVILSDLHFGSDIYAKETGALTYGKTEEARRMAFITKEILEYKKQYRNETSLNVLLLGDIIQNQLHDPRDGAPIAEQVTRAMHILNQSIGHMASSFPKVKIYCNSGNHARNTARHHGRATNQKWDSFETILFYAIKESCKSLKNVEVIIPQTPYVTYEVFGKKIFATHGDTVLNPGYPGKGIKTGVVENQINRINSSLKDSDEYSVFCLGHVHVGSVTHLGNGAVMITNGAMVPVDQFAVSIGLLESSAGQYIFESVEGYPVGDMRYIKVGQEQDKDVSLEQIIKPFEGL